MRYEPATITQSIVFYIQKKHLLKLNKFATVVVYFSVMGWKYTN